MNWLLMAGVLILGIMFSGVFAVCGLTRSNLNAFAVSAAFVGVIALGGFLIALGVTK